MRAVARVLFPCLVALWTLTATATACPPSQLGAEPDWRLRQHAQAASIEMLGQRTREVTAALVALAIALGSIVAVMGPAADARRSRARRRRSTAAIDRALVATLARKTQARAIASTLLAIVAAYAVVITMHDPAPHLLLLIAPAVMFSRALAMLVRAQLALRVLCEPRVTTLYDGSRFVFVLDGGELVGWITAWPSTLEREVARGMPAARAR